MSARKTRNEPRHFPFTTLSVYEESAPQVIGAVVDVTEKGLRLKGIDARVDEIKRLVIVAKKLFKVAPITVEAICRWRDGHGPDEQFDSGFEITTISKADALELQGLIRMLTFGTSSGAAPEDVAKLRKERRD